MNEMESNLSGPSPTGTSQVNPAMRLCFAPSAFHIAQIQQWLIHERENFNEGFYCNWPQIIHSFEHNLMIVLLRNEMAIGFLTYMHCSDFSTTIEIFEISREHRRQGCGKLLADRFFSYLQDNAVYTVELLSEPISSKSFWQHMGFTEFPPLEVHNSAPGHFYKILVNTQDPVYVVPTCEFISVWAMTSRSEATPANWVWDIDRVDKDSSAILPIVHPMDDHWLIEWQKEGKVLYSGSIRKFKAKAADYGDFLILCNLPLQQ